MTTTRRVLAASALVTAIFTLGFHGFLEVQPRADLDEHIAYAERIQSPADLTSPHFLFQILLKVANAVGIAYVPAAAWILGLCYGGMAFLIGREMGLRGATQTAFRLFVVVPAALIASHVFLLTVLVPNLYYGYFVPIVYHNATQQLNKLFALWILFAYGAHVLEARTPSLSRAPWLGVLCVLSAVAKPSFLIAFLPAAGLRAVRDVVRRRWRQIAIYVCGIALPSVAILLWQSRVAYAGQGIRVLFAPFAVFDVAPTLYKLPASLAFPAVVAVIAWRTGTVTDRLRFVWLFTGVALFATLGLAEGENMMAGNFAWTGQTAVFLAYVESTLHLVTAAVPLPLARVGWSVFSVHVACGVAWYLAGFAPERPSWL